MTFDQFNNFILRLSQYAREPNPGFSIIKDIFDFIDIRRDGIIDMNEWMQTFKSVEVTLSFFIPCSTYHHTRNMR